MKEGFLGNQKGLTDIVDWWSNTNQATALIGIILGIVFKFIDGFQIEYIRARHKPKVRFDWKAFWLPTILAFFFSVVMYSGLLSAVASVKSDLLGLSIAAQNGFFWQ